MPTYIIRAPANRLSPEQKARLARMITHTHSEIIGAQPYFTQVIFREIDPGDVFLGGKPLDGELLFIQGHIRAGRGAVERASLIRKLVPEVMEIAGMPRHAVWVYLSELPSRAMAEYGHMLPETGGEEDWLAALSSEERARVEGRPEGG
jgi:phenylpyruvate tautomerase PptA (4-oxalocrotonate tautomerase family)